MHSDSLYLSSRIGFLTCPWFILPSHPPMADSGSMDDHIIGLTVAGTAVDSHHIPVFQARTLRIKIYAS